MIKAMITKAYLAKATTVLGALTFATAGAGAADVLPQAAQDRVAGAVEKVSALDLPDSKDRARKADKADKADRADKAPRADGGDADEGEKPEKAGKPDKGDKGDKAPKPAKDNFGRVVSERARSTEDKGRQFGQSVSAEARARADARREGAKPAP
ncbi:MAG: hypothetical protein M3378_09365 [Actinomycetota bacterium]|nr:hypothetical protein [Actinomycetota bacterium]